MALCHKDITVPEPIRAKPGYIPGQVSVVRIRGLCQETIFDTEYLLTLDAAGRLLYLGKYSSSISFNSSSHVWQWFDQKNNQSQAIR